LLLCSQSPRRRQILEELGIPIVVRAAAVDEAVVAGETIDAYLARVVEAKLWAAVARIETLTPAAALAADTVVVLDGEILGKPEDTRDAVRLLRRLAGRVHTVLTRFAILDLGRRDAPVCARTVESRVQMRSATTDELERYAATGEGLDKAGAYAVQGCGAFLVERVEGSPSNVIGLPACEVVVELVRAKLVDAFPLVHQ
jgi:septum formation protein